MDILTPSSIEAQDPEFFAAIAGEERRQKENLELIASENYASRAVREAMGCVMTNKYAEGYPGKRYYGGCEWVDVAETLAIDRAEANSSAPTTPTCSRTPARRPTWPSSWRCCSPATRCSACRSRTAAT